MSRYLKKKRQTIILSFFYFYSIVCSISAHMLQNCGPTFFHVIVFTALENKSRHILPIQIINQYLCLKCATYQNKSERRKYSTEVLGSNSLYLQQLVNSVQFSVKMISAVSQGRHFVASRIYLLIIFSGNDLEYGNKMIH